MKKNFPFRSLAEQVNFMRSNPVEVSVMFTTAGNKKVASLVQITLNQILDRQPRNTIVQKFKTDFLIIKKKHPEVMERNVRKVIFWYLDAACDWVKYQQIGMDEVLK